MLGRRRVVKAGGPTVKNVSGYDLCRLLVGSLGTLGLHRRGHPAHPPRARGVAVVRRRGRPVRPARGRASAGTRAVGRRDHVGAARGPPRRRRRAGGAGRSRPRSTDLPALPAATGGRCRRATLRRPHRHGSWPRSASASCTMPTRRRRRVALDPAVAELHRAAEVDLFDPTGRLNPGRVVYLMSSAREARPRRRPSSPRAWRAGCACRTARRTG